MSGKEPTQSQRIAAAYDVLEELGWRRATVREARGLPLGTPEQRRTVRAALDKGDWEAWQEHGLRHLKNAPEGRTLPALYAARAGASVKRVVELVEILDGDPEVWDACADVLAARRPEAELEYLGRFWGEFMRSSTNGESNMAGPILRRVAARNLPLPESVEYTKDFWAHAASHLGATDEIQYWEIAHQPVGEEVVRPRFGEHLALTARLGAPVTGPAGPALAAAARLGWASQAELLDAALVGLDAAQRPGDRKVWAQLLAGAADGEALAGRLDELVPLLSLGEAPLAEAAGLPLVEALDDARLGELALALSGVGPAKTRQAILKALRSRPVPGAAVAAEVLESLAPWAQKPGPVAKALESLRSAWGVDEAPAPAGEELFVPWPATPPVWEVPRVDFGEASEAALAAAAAVLVDRDERVVDLAVERFLVLANQLAAADPEAVKRVVKTTGSTFEHRPGLDDVARWAVHGRTVTDHGSDDLASRRTNHVAGRAGSLPAILSAPSWEDLRVDAAELVDRLGAYAAAGLPVVDTDLLLALLRLEPTSASAEARTRLEELDVPVIAFNGPLRHGVEAGSVILEYLEHPLAEPVITPAPDFARWARSTVETPSVLRFTLVRPSPNAWAKETFSTVPSWGDAIGRALGGGWYEPAEDTPTAAWLQLSRRAALLTPGLAVNLLAGLRRKDPAERSAQFAAARLAWERGLLRPGVADLAFIDWEGTPTQLAALAEAWLEAAEDGLLPAVWPLLDGLCAWAAPQRRMPAGVSEVSAAMARLAPSVLAAVGRSEAPAEALSVPGLRALAARGGTSQAVLNARAALEGFPEAAALETPVVAAPARLTEAEFEAAWRRPKKGLPDPEVIPDGATLVARALPRPASGAGLVFDLGVPGEPATLRIDKWTWTYDLYTSRTCHAVRLGADGQLPPGARPGTNDCWLAWEEGKGLTVNPFPNRRDFPDLSSTLAAIAVGILAQHGDGGLAGRHSLEILLKEGHLGPARVADAARALLPFADAVSPARLAGAARKLPLWLPALWPLLTEPVAFAAGLEGAPPRWLAPVLDVALEFAPALREAGVRGLIPRQWEGLAALAARPGKAAALAKARLLTEALA